VSELTVCATPSDCPSPGSQCSPYGGVEGTNVSTCY
jgi:hypothetical protein